MNLLTRAIAAQKFLFSTLHHSRKCLVSPHPISSLEQFSMFSTSKDYQNTIRRRTQYPRKPRITTPSSESSPSSSSSLSWSQRVKKQAEALPSKWPKPSEIPYQAKVANSVNLIGIIQMPVQFHATPDGKHLAATFVAQENGGKSGLSLVSSSSSASSSSLSSSSLSHSLMIPVVFEGDLAHIVACHVKQNDCVYVTGKLCVDPLPFVLSEDQGRFHVLGQELNFVEGFKGSVPGRAGKDFGVAADAVSRLDNVETKNVAKEDAGDRLPSVGSGNAVEKLWEEVFAKPDEWWVIRSESDGLDGEIVGFERKDTGESVQTDEFTPWWVYKKLRTLQFDEKVDQKSFNDVGTTGDGVTDYKINQKSSNNVGTVKDGDSIFSSWRDLVRNPKDWWDNRERKSNGLVKANYPDFKHKTNGTALWLNKAPNWVLPGLQGLEFDVHVCKGQQAQGGKEVCQGQWAKGGKGDDHWKSLVENPEKWWDNRVGKTNKRAPDFRHKETGEALWLNRSPSWVPSKLPPLKNKQSVAAGGKSSQAI